jgi:hypothetical protein
MNFPAPGRTFEADFVPDLAPLPADAVEVAVECRQAMALVPRNRLDGDCVAVAERGSPTLEVRRAPPSITLELEEPPSPEALLHPLLTGPISILARWRGDLTLHAGAFFAAGRAWGVMGAREAGKSTTLATLAGRGCPLLADDLLVLDDRVVRAGPACVDLRPDSARRLPEARFLGEVGGRPRYRLGSPTGPARAPLGGLFLLDWGGAPEPVAEQLPPSEALSTVFEQEYIGLMGPTDPEKVLDLLAAPVWRVRRRRDWDQAEAVADLMLAIASGLEGRFDARAAQPDPS